MIRIKRIYVPSSESDGFRVLTDRLWPRGIKKADAHIALWAKDAAPSAALRKWFGHEPAKWEEFLQRYRAELEASSALEKLAATLQGHNTVTLLYGAKEERYNQAVALKQFLEH